MSNQTLRHMQLHILKTNIKNPEDIHKIRTLMLHLNIKCWSIDEDDIDRVLRVESLLNTVEIIESIKNTGIQCEELQD